MGYKDGQSTSSALEETEQAAEANIPGLCTPKSLGAVHPKGPCFGFPVTFLFSETLPASHSLRALHLLG